MSLNAKIRSAISPRLASMIAGRGRKEGQVLRRTRYFQRDYYIKQLPDGLRFNPERHFIETGWRLGLNPSPFFDVSFYLSKYDDVRRARINPLLHYIEYGWKERRSPHPVFDVATFTKVHPSADSSDIDVAEYCIQLYGTLAWREGALAWEPPKGIKSDLSDESLKLLKDSKYFDEEYYRSMYPDVSRENIVLASHYLSVGWRENRNPSHEFDTHYYMSANAKVRENGTCPLVQFLKAGDAGSRRCRSAKSITLVNQNPQRHTRSTPLSVAVHIHLYYVDLIEEITLCLGYLPASVHVVCTVLSEADRRFAELTFARRLPALTVDVRVVPNRGRDIAPMLVATRDIWSAYDIVGHLHTKRSPHTTFGDDWRHYVFDQLMGSSAKIASILDAFAADETIGMLYPENYYQIKKFVRWGDNAERILKVLREIGASVNRLPQPAEFAASSMAWYRSKALTALCERFSSFDDFEEESNQLDFTTAHVIERVLPLAVEAAGLRALAYYSSRRDANAYRQTLHSANTGSDAVGQRWLRDTPAIMRNRWLPLEPRSRVFDKQSLNIHWIIPDFARGAGGHMTIFRIVELLAAAGHKQTIWIQNARNHETPAIAKLRIQSWYRRIPDDVIVRFLPDDVKQLSGDVVIATDCWTAYPAATARTFKERFYLIQDYEPLFHPMGGLYITAEATYRMAFAALCAGDWLMEKATAHGMWARKWDLASDDEYYFESRKTKVATDDRVHIAFYARNYTPRRAVELGIAALEELMRRGVKFTAHMFGEDVPHRKFAFPSVEHGILSPKELGELYRGADLGLVFSTTNYSLIPLEMMACGLPVVEIDVESTRAVFSEGEVQFASPEPHGIANAIQQLIGDPARCSAQIARASKFVSGLSWKESARRIEAAIFERLESRGYVGVLPKSICAPLPKTAIEASVFIPTFNAGEAFSQVLERLTSQRTKSKYEVLVIDSGSTDGTVEMVRRYRDKGVRLHEIPNSEFQHGRTRNLGISMTEGPYVAIITQDALPADERWLASLVSGFSKSDRVAGVIGRHLAYPDHGPFVARDLSEMFDRFAEYPEVYSMSRGLPSLIYRGSVPWQMMLHFYSDNNSCMARSVWREIPYPEVDWGEDMIWAWEVLKVGFEKVYVDEARVYHSHQLTPEAHYKVSVLEGKLFKEKFGYSLYSDERGVKHDIENANHRDTLYAAKHQIPSAELKKRKEINKLTAEGRWAGAASVALDAD